MPTPVSQRVGRSGEREQVPDEDIHDGDHDEGCEPVPTPGGRQPLPRRSLRVSYDIDQPADGADPDQYGDDEHEGVGRPGGGHVTTDERLRHVSTAAEGTEPTGHCTERARKTEPCHEMCGTHPEADKADRPDPEQCFPRRNWLVDAPFHGHGNALQ